MRQRVLALVLLLAAAGASIGQSPSDAPTGVLVRFEDLTRQALQVAAPDSLATLEYPPDAKQVLSERDVDSSTLDTYVFAEGEYRLVSSVLLEERGVSAWLEGLTP